MSAEQTLNDSNMWTAGLSDPSGDASAPKPSPPPSPIPLGAQQGFGAHLMISCKHCGRIEVEPPTLVVDEEGDTLAITPKEVRPNNMCHSCAELAEASKRGQEALSAAAAAAASGGAAAGGGQFEDPMSKDLMAVQRTMSEAPEKSSRYQQSGASGALCKPRDIDFRQQIHGSTRWGSLSTTRQFNAVIKVSVGIDKAAMAAMECLPKDGPHGEYLEENRGANLEGVEELFERYSKKNTNPEDQPVGAAGLKQPKDPFSEAMAMVIALGPAVGGSPELQDRIAKLVQGFAVRYPGIVVVLHAEGARVLSPPLPDLDAWCIALGPSHLGIQKINSWIKRCKVTTSIEEIQEAVQAATVQWLWNYGSWDEPIWRLYDVAHQRLIEETYNKGERTVEFRVKNRGMNEVDLMLMRQYPINVKTRQRAVRRSPPVFDEMALLHRHEHLLDEITAGNCIIFLGSGFCVPAGAPNWVQLLVAIAKRAVDERPGTNPDLLGTVERLTRDWEADKLEQAAQLLEDELTHSTMCEIVASEVQRPSQSSLARAHHHPVTAATIRDNPKDYPVMYERLKFVRDTPFDAVLTTNYNDHWDGTGVSPLCQTAGKKANYNKLLRPPVTSANTRKSRVLMAGTKEKPVYMLHGTVEEPQSIVLTTEAYRRLLHQYKSYANFLRSVMSTKTILYLGFSFSDGYLNELRSEVKSMLDEGGRGGRSCTPLAYAIINDKEAGDIDFFLEHEGVQILTWDTKEHGYGVADRLLFGISSLTNPYLMFGSRLALVDIFWLHAEEPAGEGSEPEMHGVFRDFITKCKSLYDETVPHHVASVFYETTSTAALKRAISGKDPSLQAKRRNSQEHHRAKHKICIHNMGDGGGQGMDLLAFSGHDSSQLEGSYPPQAGPIVNIVFSRSPLFFQKAVKGGASAYCTDVHELVDALYSYIDFLGCCDEHDDTSAAESDRLAS